MPTSEQVEPSSRGVDLGYVTLSRRVLYAQGALIALVALLAFSLGYAVGRSRTAAAPEQVTPERIAVSGRVTFENSLGEKVPDDGAIVLLMPATRRLKRAERPSLLGLRPADPPLDDNDPVLTAIRGFGGAYARADDRGVVELLPLRRGDYFALWVSKGAARPEDRPPRPEDLNALGAFVSDADQMIGAQKYSFSTVTIGTGTSGKGASIDRHFDANR